MSKPIRQQAHAVEVVWIDSAFHRGWGSHENKVREMQIETCRTVGFLLEKTSRVVKVAQSVSDGTFADGISIPRRCVKSIKRLK